MGPPAAHLIARTATALGFLFLAAMVSRAQAADPILAGLEGVDLGVELHHDAGRRLGLTVEQAYRAVGEELRQAGVRFLPTPERRTDVGGRFRRMPKGYALLYFQVAAVVDGNPGGNYTVDIRLDLLDRVRLSRDGSKETVASIYKGRQLVLMRGIGGREEVLDRLRTLVREFAADFNASNPRGAGSGRVG